MDGRETPAFNQTAYLVWTPQRAKRAVCLAYGGHLSSSLLDGLAEHVEIELSGSCANGSLDTVMLIGHPDKSAAAGEHTVEGFISTIRRAWGCLRESGTLVVAFDPSSRPALTPLAVGAWFRPETWFTLRSIENAVQSLRPQHTSRLHVFPSVWRPVILQAPESPSSLKRLALAHSGGWRAGALGRFLVAGGRSSIVDLFPGGIVWVARR